MISKAKYKIFLIFILFVRTGFSQKLTFYNKYSFENGLNSINVSKTKYDKYGFLWIATQDGLFRFDGRNFEKILGDSLGVNEPGIFVSDFHILDTQIVVSWYNAGCGILNLRSLKWDYNLSKKILFGTEIVNKITETSSLYLSSTKGLIYFDNTPNLLRATKNTNILNGGKVGKDTWYYLTEHGDLFITDANSIKKQRLNVGNSKILQAYAFSNGIIYLEDEEIKMYYTIDNSRTHTQYCRKEILGLFQNSLNEYIAYSYDSLYNLKLNSSEIYSFDIKSLHLEKKNINHINFENKMFLWVSTTEGLELYSFKNRLFNKYIPTGVSQENELHFYSIDSFSSTQIIASSRKGLYILDINTKEYKLVKNTQKFGMTHCSFRINNDTYFSSELGIYKLDLKYNTLNRISDKYNEWKPYDKYMFNCVLKYNDSIMLLGGEDEQGVLKWNMKNSNISFIKAEGQNHIRKLVPTQDDNVMILSDNGIRKYNPVSNRVLNSIQFNHISLYFDLLQIKEKVFISTYSSGLIYLDLLHNKIYSINEENGLSNNACYEIKMQNDSIIWVSTNMGLNKINVKNLSVSNYYLSDSLHSNSFDELGSCRLNNELYFSGLNGITRIENISQDSSYYYRFYISSLEYINNDRKYKMFELNESNTILPANSSSIKFVLSNNNPMDQKGTFWYKLNSGNWHEVEKSNIIKFDLLAYGNYVLRVKFNNKEGLETKVISNVHFKILPPWYQTWWFRILLGVVVLANGIWITQLYYKRKLIAQQKELEKQLALQSERDRISNDMHDDLGSGLSSIKLISEMLKIKHSDLETKNDLNEIVDYATDLTDTMREMVWSLNPRNDSLSKFVDHSIAYAKHFFEPSDIKFEVTTSPEFPEITMSGFVRRNLFLSLKEIFNNIIKHSGARKVSFSIKYVDNKLFIIIQDDGKGIADNSMKGNGLYSLKKRIADCEGVIVWNNMDFGLSTSITVSL